MASSSNKKLLLFYVLNILQEYTDENHTLTQKEIANKIYSLYSMECERKAIASNIDNLTELGYDIIKTARNGVYLGQRDFENSEVSFLIDAVFSSKSIPSKHSKELANKLMKNLSVYDRKKFKYVYKADSITRTNNKQLFYTIDTISRAIEEGKQISFIYSVYNEKGELVARKNEKPYIINPYFMINNKGQYYLVCNFDYYNSISHYKLELISQIKILDKELKPLTKLEGYEKGLDIAEHINSNVYMFGGKKISAKIKLETKDAMNYVIEWFGKTASITTENSQKIANIKTNELALIYWCLQYGEHATLLSPAETKEKIKQQIEHLKNSYN